MKRLTRDDVLKADDLLTQEIEVPQWGGTIIIKALSLGAKNKIDQQTKDGSGKTDPEKLTMLFLMEGIHEPKFTMADYEALKGKNNGVLEDIVKKIMKLSFVSAEAKNA